MTHTTAVRREDKGTHLCITYERPLTRTEAFSDEARRKSSNVDLSYRKKGDC